MADTGYSSYKFNGQSLQTYAWNLESISGLDGLPARRGSNIRTPYSDGDYSFGDKFYDSRTLTMTLLVFGQDANGAVTASDGPYYHLQKNIDDLKAILHQNAGLQTFSFVVKDGIGGTITREIDVEIMTAVEIQSSANLVKKLVVQLECPRPMWRELPKVTVNRNGITVFPDSFTIDTLGNTRIQDVVITIDANAAGQNPYIECVPNGDRITIQDSPATNDQYVIDLGSKSFTKNGTRADGFIGRTSATYLLLPPAATLSMEFGATSGDYDLTLEYYKKWL